MSLQPIEPLAPAVEATSRNSRWPRFRSLLAFGRAPAGLSTLFVQKDSAWAWEPPRSRHDTPVAPVRYDSVNDWIARHEGRRVRLLLSGGLQHHLVLRDDALPLHDEAALVAYARHQFVHFHGSAAEHWPLAVWADKRKRGACALHGLDLPALTEQARRRGVRVATVLPWWACALGAATRCDATLAQVERAGLLLVEGHLLTCLSIERGAVVDLELRHMDEATLAAARVAASEWHEEHFDARATVLLAGYGLTAVDIPLPASSSLRVLGALSSLAAAHPPFEWVHP